MTLVSPFSEIDRLQRANRRLAGEGTGAVSLVVPVLLGVFTAPFAEPILLRTLDGNAATVAVGLNATTYRLALVLAGVMLLWSYSLIIRGKDRMVLDPFPVDGASFPPVLARRLLRDSSGLALGAVALLWPVLTAGHTSAFILGASTVIGGWLVGVGVGFPLHLAAASAATSESLEAALQAIRGDNPAMQAAWIYAPGVGLLLCGISLSFATAATTAHLVTGAVPLGILAPPLIGGACYSFAARLSQKNWYLASTLVREIDSAYAATENPEEARIAYLEWTSRWAPETLRPHLLRAYRHGWRALRPWTLAPVLGGVVAGIAGWSRTPGATNDALQIAGFTVLCSAAIALRMAAQEPKVLNEAIGLRASALIASRSLAVWAWQQPAVLLPLFTIGLAHGRDSLHYVAAIEALTIIAACLSAAVSPLKSAGLLVYAPGAIALWVITVGVFP